MRRIILSNGKTIPCMGYGCYNAFGAEITDAVRIAIEEGYTYIDSAEMYKNEEAVGEAVGFFRDRRDSLFILSKAWPSSFDDLETACRRSIRNLQSEYLDGYLLHWPGTDEKRRLKAYEQMLSLTEKGLAGTPGVSNFNKEQLEQVKKEFGAYPVLLELECHPSYQQKELVDWCRERRIQVISYQPINRSADLSLPVLSGLSEKYGKTPAQIVMRWHIQEDHIPIPKSSNAGRIRENIDVFDFELDAADAAALDAADTGVRSGLDPSAFPPGF